MTRPLLWTDPTVTIEQKVRARHALGHAVENGLVKPRPCEKCGAEPAQGHHEDYAQTLVVRWLCAAHHSQLHNQRYSLTKRCEACGTEFTPHPTKRKRAKSCSPACRAALIAKTLREKADPNRPKWTKLDPAKADAIRQRYATGRETMAEIGRDFGIGKDAVADVVHGVTWADRSLAVDSDQLAVQMDGGRV